MKKSLITGLVLAFFAIVCGALLAIVNSFTAPVIKAHEEEKIQESIAVVYEGFNKDEYKAEKFTRDGAKEAYYIIKLDTDEKVAVIYIVESQGYASKIRMMIGVDKEYKVTGYTVISQAETKGDITAHDFNMSGKDDLSTFDKLAGSTYSSKAVKKNFTLALSYAKEDLK